MDETASSRADGAPQWDQSRSAGLARPAQPGPVAGGPTPYLGVDTGRL